MNHDTIQFKHAGDPFIVTINSPEPLGKLDTDQVSTLPTSGWEKVPGLVRTELTPAAQAALGVTATQELWAWLEGLEPNELDGWDTYLYLVRPSAMREAVAVVALTYKYEVALVWELPDDVQALEPSTSDDAKDREIS